ncbi:hypothetical protein ACJRO7_027729 [Eucalyptus globulus]|uniref:thymidylate synthase n=1 Tax=Eucalyptus globulus TaxID=34317 RepID=A0ABD3JY24_EUCGL
MASIFFLNNFQVLPHFQRIWLCSLYFKLLSFGCFQPLSSVTTSEVLVIPNGNCNGTPSDSQRTYQVVDENLPWRLPSDLNFFKSITLSTIDPGGLYLADYVVLTYYGSFDIASVENIIDCGSMCSAVLFYWLHLLIVYQLRNYLCSYRMFRSGFLPQKNCMIFNGKRDSVKFEVKNFTIVLKMIFKRHEEYLYLRLIKDVLLNGTPKDDRTKTGTVSTFASQVLGITLFILFLRIHFHLCKTFPFLTTKILQGKGIHIWDVNASRDYLDHFICLASFSQNSLCFLFYFSLVNLILALPFYVVNGELSSQMYQRSADMGLIVPFNIASYALLTCMIAHVCDLSPSDFVHGIGDAHILKINPERKDIDSFLAADFQLIGYGPHDKLEMEMADWS